MAGLLDVGAARERAGLDVGGQVEQTAGGGQEDPEPEERVLGRPERRGGRGGGADGPFDPRRHSPGPAARLGTVESGDLLG